MNTCHTVLLLTAALAFSACGDDDPPTAADLGIDTADATTDTADAGVDSSDVPSDEGSDSEGVSLAPWNDVCASDEECTAPTDYCVTQPGAPEGYCTIHCEGLSACAEGPTGWTCNTISFAGCEDVSTNWCGPSSELETFEGVVVACE